MTVTVRSVLSLVALALTTGCAGSAASLDDGARARLADYGACAEEGADLMHQTTPVGSVTIGYTDDAVVVAVDTDGDWSLTNVQLYLGGGPVPSNKSGNPIPGHFPFKALDIGAGSVEISVPFTDLDIACGDSLLMALHADIEGEDEGDGAWAWIEGATVLKSTGAGVAQSWSFDIDVACCDDVGCTYEFGDWKNTPIASWPGEGEMTLGGVDYDYTTLMGLLWTSPSGGDQSLILVHQLVPALLNLANGAAEPADVTAAIAGAQAWLTDQKGDLEGLPYATKDNGAEGHKDVLEAFNKGCLGVPYCDADADREGVCDSE